jgi:hypothetical protein
MFSVLLSFDLRIYVILIHLFLSSWGFDTEVPRWRTPPVPVPNTCVALFGVLLLRAGDGALLHTLTLFHT